jgi:hypothetical protein
VQGDSITARRDSLRSAALLVAAHIATAGLIVAVLYQVGTVTAGLLPRDVVLWIFGLLSVVAIGLDLRAIRGDTYTLGLKRQTAKSLMNAEDRPTWVTPLFWGLDTGLIWTTFRVSCTSWLLLLGALFNLTPQWGGLVYGAFFGLPLMTAIWWRGYRRHTKPGRPATLRRAQGAGVVLMGLLPIGLIVGHFVGA